ncbi:hypothetical protein [Nocardia tengchongensis]|uniref:hypothetical protein n=1 Tax=Nocardia tengchongensis TaxID=2055889 RepID=UPI00360846E0
MPVTELGTYLLGVPSRVGSCSHRPLHPTWTSSVEWLFTQTDISYGDPGFEQCTRICTR